ncbi:MAG: hypothetical protein HYX50_03040 [Chloroflexi bacterium]|nr:hypothetical protein [Chloroflexota bacterium]
MTHPQAMEAAVRRQEWERVALSLLLGMALAAREASDAEVADLLAVLTAREEGGDADKRRAPR